MEKVENKKKTGTFYYRRWIDVMKKITL